MKLFRNPWLWCLWASLIAIALIWTAYRFNWPGTGFQGKTVWDWLSLLIIPLAVALVALFFNQMNTGTERQIALDKQREELLQAYLDRMSELLLEKGLRTSQPEEEMRNVARTRTISVLRQLDSKRVGDVFTFLREAGLADKTEPVISFKYADFSAVNWRGANLKNANLSGADLSRSDLSYANLAGAYLSKCRFQEARLIHSRLDSAKLGEANLFGANLRGASLINADLFHASLSFANLSKADLTYAKLYNSHLDYARFRGAKLNQTDLRHAEINKSQFTSWQIAQAIWDQKKKDEMAL